MITLGGLVSTVAAVSSLALAALALKSRPRQPLQWTFALGMAGLALEAFAALMLLTAPTSSAFLFWLSAVKIAGILLLVPWAFFVVALADLNMPSPPRSWRIGLAGGVALVALSTIAVGVGPAFQAAPAVWRTPGATLLPVARYASIVELLLTVGILAWLEACLRTSRGANRQRVKYLVLGLGGMFLVRFYLLSQVLLFHTIVPVYVKTMAAALVVTNLFIALPIARDELRGVRLTVSRQMVYRSAVVGVLGLYLFVVAALGSLLTYLAVPEETFWGSVIVFASALGLTALLLSDDVRWRIQRFIAVHFYRSKYDYREQWIAFTERMGSLVTAEELGPELVQAVTEAVGTTTGALYLEETGEIHGYRLAGTVGNTRYPSLLPADAALARELRTAAAPLELTKDHGVEGTVAVGLTWRATLVGFIVLGPERTGNPYTAEDIEFLTTVAEQAAGSIMNARLSEALAHARELETFDRVTSAVIHDVKNSVSALSLLSRNALRNFDDPEFQRDTITTLSRTVERMTRLLGKLSSPVEASPLRTDRVDLAAVVLEATTHLAADDRVRLRREVTPVGEVYGDRDALLRVVENLVTNAVEAIEGQGTVTVKLSEEDGRAVIVVSDTGCGIPEDFLRRFLFSPFRSTKKGGWGIGLYHTKQVVERHDGEIHVESMEGRGTTFWVKLPLTCDGGEPSGGDGPDAKAWERVR